MLESGSKEELSYSPMFISETTISAGGGDTWICDQTVSQLHSKMHPRMKYFFVNVAIRDIVWSPIGHVFAFTINN